MFFGKRYAQWRDSGYISPTVNHALRTKDAVGGTHLSPTCYILARPITGANLATAVGGRFFLVVLVRET